MRLPRVHAPHTALVIAGAVLFSCVQAPIAALVFAVLLLCSCAQRESAPHMLIEGIAKSRQEIQELTAQVQQGDASAALTLANHYMLVENDYARAGHWFRMAAKLGGEKEKEIYRSFVERD